MKNIFVTGCTGYIGSHTCVELLDGNYNVIGLDNFSNSKRSVLDNITKITGKSIKFYEGNMLDKELLDKIFSENEIDAVIDFAAFKSVGDSVSKPIEYYINNVSSVLTLLSVMKNHNVKTLVFSSSATVYGDSKIMPITEECKIGGTTNPYGTSKLYCEGILQDLYKSDNDWNICIFRYFNPVGAHKSGLIGEEPNGIPANLMPFISKVATKELEILSVFGNDYDTPDGTGVRDYIHVNDLAQAHILAMEYLSKGGESNIFNLGNGVGFTVKEVIEMARKVTNHTIPIREEERRAGDPSVLIASSEKARKVLGWKPQYADLETIISTAWKWHVNHPDGY